MGAIFYYLSLPLLYLVSLLPFRLLYGVSDVLYVVLYRWFGYRKQVVLTNMRNAFPEKDEQEIRALCDRFYRHFCDVILETIKTLTVSAAAVERRVLFEDRSVFEEYQRRGQSIILALGHYGNWELAGARFSQAGLHQLYVIYNPLKNKRFDRLAYHMRTRLGTRLYRRKETWTSMLEDREHLTATAFIADQTPSRHSAYWTTFLNQDTAVFQGMDKIARKLNYPVIYATIKRVKRGYYHIESELLAAEPKHLAEMETTELFTRRLERDIREQPEHWLWTHKRWKHRREGV